MVISMQPQSTGNRAARFGFIATVLLVFTCPFILYWTGAPELWMRFGAFGQQILGVRPAEFQAGVFVAVVALAVTIGGILFFDIPERKRWEESKKRR
jgi:hypothetical protein